MSESELGCKFIQCAQGSDEWFQARLGKCTASEFPELMKKGRGGAPSLSAVTYQYQLIAESLTQVTHKVSSAPLDWGNKYEDAARAIYSFRTGNNVDRHGFCTMLDNDRVGCSSDGLVGNDGNIEIKCPYNSVNHLKTLLRGTMPAEYEAQVQGQLWVLGRDWCDFCSFDPRMPSDKKLAIIRVERDEEYIEGLSERVTAFLDDMDELAERINEAAKDYERQSES